MDYCVKHQQFYTNYCVYCGSPFSIQTTSTTGNLYGIPIHKTVCVVCKKEIKGKKSKHKCK